FCRGPPVVVDCVVSAIPAVPTSWGALATKPIRVRGSAGFWAACREGQIRWIMMNPAVRRGARATPGWSFRKRPGLVAGGDGASRYSLAGFFLRDPAGFDDNVEVVLGDRQRCEEDGLHLDALRPAAEGLHIGDLVHGLATG